jgi:hypothetical protein
MKNMFIIIMVSVSIVSSFAEESNIPEFRARIDCFSQDVGIRAVKAPENGIFRNYSWGLKELRKCCLTGEYPLHDTEEWTEGLFMFMPESDGTVTIRLMSNHSSTRGKKKYNAHWIYYDDISIIGAEFSNGSFEELDENGMPVGWSLYCGKKNLVTGGVQPLSGKVMIKAWHNCSVTVDVKVKKGIPVTIILHAMKAYFESA